MQDLAVSLAGRTVYRLYANLKFLTTVLTTGFNYASSKTIGLLPSKIQNLLLMMHLALFYPFLGPKGDTSVQYL